MHQLDINLVFLLLSLLLVQEIEVLHPVYLESGLLHNAIFEHILSLFFPGESVKMVTAVDLDYLIVFWEV